MGAADSLAEVAEVVAISLHSEFLAVEVVLRHPGVELLELELAVVAADMGLVVHHHMEVLEEGIDQMVPPAVPAMAS